jgi:hypothetical protein
MEVPEGKSLCSDLKRTKMSLFFSFTKSENSSCLGVLGTSGRHRRWGKGAREGEYGTNTYWYVNGK